MAVINLPFPEYGESTEQTVKNLYDIVIRLRKELEYALTHLDEGNFPSLQSLIDELSDSEVILIPNIESTTIVTQVLYSTDGNISRLTVDKLLSGSPLEGTTEINYIDIENQTIKLITGTKNTSLPQVQYQNINDEGLYWLDSSQETMTPDAVDDEGVARTAVMVYQYDLLVKASFGFFYDSVSGYYVPRITLGAGTGTGDSGKSIIYKDDDELIIEYISEGGDTRKISLGNVGILVDQGEVDNGIRNITYKTTVPTVADMNNGDIWFKYTT